MKKYLLTIAYDGSNYSGWQSQNNAETIQNTIEKAIFQITSKKVNLFASGRTDAKVHAENQKAHFEIDKVLNLEKFKKSINAVLPDDIFIKEIKEVSKDFHARFDVKKKIYEYRINIGDKNIFTDKYELYIPYNIDIKAMKKASKYLLNEHDFSAFCSAKTNVTDFVRKIYYIKFIENNNKLSIRICGNGFLYNMVRIIVGTLLEVGKGNIKPIEVKNILESKDRQKAGKTVLAKGLFLFNVEY